MFGGSIGVGAAYPLDTVKVKMQAYNARAGGSLTVARAGAVEVVRRVLAEEGVGGFYSGCSSTMVGQAFIKGTAFLVYDVSKNYFPPTALGLYLAACVSGLAASFVPLPRKRRPSFPPARNKKRTKTRAPRASRVVCVPPPYTPMPLSLSRVLRRSGFSALNVSPRAERRRS